MSYKNPFLIPGLRNIRENKECSNCKERETRMDARYCCWCGAPFSVIIIEGRAYKTETIMVLKELKDVTDSVVDE